MNIRTTFTISLILSLLFLSNGISTAHAQTAQESEANRDITITKELSLTIPDKTEDPSYPITFVDPSKKGVDITVAGKTTTKAVSPFILPNLAIGEHTVAFSFKNSTGQPRYLQKNILIVPKAPLFDGTLRTSIVLPDPVIVKGTALPQAQVTLVVNSEFVHTISVNPEGSWEFIIPEPKIGVNNVIAFANKNGITSNASRVYSFEFTNQKQETSQTTEQMSVEQTLQSYITQINENISYNQKNNPEIFYSVISGAALLILLLVSWSIRSRLAKKRDEKTIAALFSSQNSAKPSILEVISNKTSKETAPHEEPAPTEDKAKKVKKAMAELREELEMPLPEVKNPELDQSKSVQKVNFFSRLFKKSPQAPPVEPEPQPAPAEPSVPKKINKKARKKVKKIKRDQVQLTQTEPNDETVSEEVDITPERKTISKDEFLKQFMKGDKQDEA